MLRKIILENYMSHERTEIDLGPGLTVLAGPNNCGKSAVVSALQTLCGDHFRDGPFMVRHGQRECSVTVETDDGHTITWRRKGDALSYTIDGETISRGRAPDKLPETLRLEKVQPAERKEAFDVHFGRQKSPIFLINSPSDTAAFFSTSSDAERLLELQRLHREKTRKARGDERTLGEEIAAHERRLGALTPLDELAPRLEQAEADHQALLRQAGEIEALRLTMEKIEQIARRQRQFEAQVAAAEPLAAPPAMVDTVPIEAIRQEIERLALAQAQHRAALEATRPLHEPPKLSDEAPLELLKRRIEQCQRQHARARGEMAALGALGDPPTVEDPMPLREVGVALKKAAARVAGARRAAECLSELHEPPEVDDPAPVRDLAARMAKAMKRKTDCGTTLRLNADALAEVEKQAADLAASQPACPTCGAPIADAKRLLSGGHAHG